MSEELLLRPVEAARRVNYSPQTLAGWRMKAIVLPFVVLNGSVRYKTADIEKFIADNTVTPGAEPPADMKRRKGGTGRPPWKKKRRRTASLECHGDRSRVRKEGASTSK